MYNTVWDWNVKVTAREPTIIVWNKNNFAITRRHYHRKHEFIFYNWLGKPVWNGGHGQSDVWNIKQRPVQDYMHPTQKPILLVKKAIMNSSNENDIVLDLFGGSGTTLIAAEQTNRRCFTCEIDPKYCDVIIKRYEALTGNNAVIES